MKVKVLFFGELAQIAGNERMELENAADLNSAVQMIRDKFPAIVSKKFAIAVNKKITQDNTTLNNGDEIALLPPFSGG